MPRTTCGSLSPTGPDGGWPQRDGLAVRTAPRTPTPRPPRVGCVWPTTPLSRPETKQRLQTSARRGENGQIYVVNALNGSADGAWFRSEATGRAVVAVAQPVWSGNVQTGAVILQQGTDAILSLTNSALGRLVSFTLIATLGRCPDVARLRNLALAAHSPAERSGRNRARQPMHCNSPCRVPWPPTRSGICHGVSPAC